MSRYVDDREFRSSESRRNRDRDRVDPRERIEPTRERRVPDDPRLSDRRADSDRRGDSQMTDAMDVVIERRTDPRIDPRGMDPRIDMSRDTARANTASRIDPRPDRMVDSRSAEPNDKYIDPMTGQMYRQVPARSNFPPRDDRDYIEPPSSRSRTTVEPPASRSRTNMDTTMRDDRGRDDPRATLSEYWCSGEGIEREVLQIEICKFLGRDATCRPGVERVRHCDQ